MRGWAWRVDGTLAGPFQALWDGSQMLLACGNLLLSLEYAHMHSDMHMHMYMCRAHHIRVHKGFIHTHTAHVIPVRVQAYVCTHNTCLYM